MKAIWNGVVIAESNDTIVVENNHYFPADSVQASYLRDSARTSTCPWKGTARYKTLVVNGQTNPNAAWYYPAPSRAAAAIKNRFAFARDVTITN